MKDKKYYFPVSFLGETDSEGFVLLTKDEANIVAFATNKANWTNASGRHYGNFYIEVDEGIPEEWFPEHERLIREWEDDMCNEAV